MGVVMMLQSIKDGAFYFALSFVLWFFVYISAFYSTMISLLLVICTICGMNKFFSFSFSGMMIRTSLASLLLFIAFIFGALRQLPEGMELFILMYGLTTILVILFSYMIVCNNIDNKKEKLSSPHIAP